MKNESEINAYVNFLVCTFPDINEVWLFGSSVNPSDKEPSDWDLFVFGSDEILDSLKSNPSLKNDKIDLLIVTNGDDFMEPWPKKDGDIYTAKHDRLSDWGWKKFSPTEAEYIGAKEPKDGTGWRRSIVSKQKAIRLWPK